VPSRLLRSLRLRLLVALLLPLLVLAVVGAILDHRTAQQLTGAAHDRVLASTAIGLAARIETDRDDDLPAHLLATVRAVSRAAPDDELHYLVLDRTGRGISGDTRLAALARPGQAANPYFLDTRLGDKPVRAAVYAYEGPDGVATIFVAETLTGRTRAARSILLLTTATNLAMILAVVVAAALAVRYAMRPLDALGARVEGHEVRDLHPIALRGIPTETRPLVRAINRLMARVRRTAQERQAFINDTAHQLRTPLAGLSAEVDLLASQPMPAELAGRVHQVQRAVQRLARLANQMLALARSTGEPGRRIETRAVELPELLREAASACLDAALARRVDLGFEPAPAVVHGSPWMLREMLLNLVTNAIAHTPEGTQVTVRCAPRCEGLPHPCLEVEDDGPGIPPADRERVFQRFVRLSDADRPGSGLGLAIVRQIALRHGARVDLLDGAQGRGMRVRIVFMNERTV